MESDHINELYTKGYQGNEMHQFEKCPRPNLAMKEQINTIHQEDILST